MKKPRVLIAGAVMAALTMGGLAACAQDEPDSTDVTIDASKLELFSEVVPAEGAQIVDLTGIAPKGDKIRVGLPNIGLVNSWRVQALESTKLLAAELGIELIVTDANEDAAKQISDVEDLLAQNVDAILISPIAPEPLTPVIERAHDMGVVVVVWGSEAPTEKVTSQIVDDPYYFGWSGGEKLAEDMNYQGNVVMLRGLAGNSVEQDRYQGAADALNQYPDITIIAEEYGGWAFDQGKAITENWLATHPQIDGIWSSGASMTRGAIEAFQEAGRDLVPMSGENLNGFMKLWVDLDLKSSGPVYPSWQAPEALKIALRALQGLEIKDSYLVAPPAVTDAQSNVLLDVSDDYWVEGYLTEEQIKAIFP